jgi:hypothetical protein
MTGDEKLMSEGDPIKAVTELWPKVTDSLLL